MTPTTAEQMTKVRKELGVLADLALGPPLRWLACWMKRWRHRRRLLKAVGAVIEANPDAFTSYWEFDVFDCAIDGEALYHELVDAYEELEPGKGRRT